MGHYLRKRNVRNFWKDPIVNLCFTLAVLAFAAGVFGVFALIGGAKCLPFTIITLVIGVLLIVLGKKLKSRRKADNSK